MCHILCACACMGSLMGSSCVGYDAIGHGLASSAFPYLSNQGL